MIDILHTFHAHNRFLLTLIACLAIIKLVLNLVRSREFSSGDMKLLRLYAVVFTIQFVAGLILFVNAGSMAGWDMAQMHLQVEHVTIMLIALGLSHATAGVLRKEPSQRSKRALIFVATSMLLIFVGVGRLKGFDFWFQL